MAAPFPCTMSRGIRFVRIGKRKEKQKSPSLKCFLSSKLRCAADRWVDGMAPTRCRKESGNPQRDSLATWLPWGAIARCSPAESNGKPQQSNRTSHLPSYIIKVTKKSTGEKIANKKEKIKKKSKVRRPTIASNQSFLYHDFPRKFITPASV